MRRVFKTDPAILNSGRRACQAGKNAYGSFHLVIIFLIIAFCVIGHKTLAGSAGNPAPAGPAPAGGDQTIMPALSAEDKALLELYAKFYEELFKPEANKDAVAKKYQQLFEQRLTKGFPPGAEVMEVQLRSALAMTLRIQARLKDAESCLQQGVKKYESNPAIKAMMLMELAEYYDDVNRWADQSQALNQALKTNRTAIESRPDSQEYHQVHLMLLLDMDRLDEGMIYYRNLAAKYPGRPVIAEALSDLGTFKAMQEETSPKKICLQKIEENVNDRTSQSCVREAFEKENAQANYYLFISDFVKRHPDSYAGWFQLGYSLKFHRQEPEAAMAAFANALRLKPDYATPYYQMAHSYLLKKDYQKAAELMKMAAKVDPEFSFEAEKYQYLALEYGAKYPEALSYIRERQKNPDFKSCLPGAKAPPPDSDEEAKRPYLCMQYHFWNTAEISLMGKTDPEQAKILCLNALEHNPDEVRGVGTCYNLFPDWNARTKERSLAADNNDSNPSEFKNRETCNTPQATQLIKEFNKLTAEEQVIKGRELLNQALKLDPKCYPAHAARAYKFPLSPSFKNYFGQERYDQGVRELCESAEFLVSEDSWDLMADFALGTCYDLRGEYMKGVLLYQSLLEKFPDDPFCEDVCTPKLISFHSALGNCEAVNSLIPQVMAHRPGFSWTNLKHLEKCRPDLAKPASAPGGESGPKP